MSRRPAAHVVSPLASAAIVLTFSTPAHALTSDPLSDLLHGLTGDTEAEQPASGEIVERATITARDQKLRPGCRTYSITYDVEVPTDDWTLESSIVDRRGKGVASFAIISPNDDAIDTLTYRLCRGATVPGTFRIRSVLNWYDDPSTPNEVKVPVTRFRLSRP
ncbi:hypothetical protein [Nocardioides sp. CF8]|uniref:hypothetical protein n=1 Tax=Nocardioides sp. CF8 TaxID=110319 RepID=UPI0004007D38|nr:hypothetical protein [Nocardioides sp. CF8]